MAAHGLLDWRLAGDLLDLVATGSVDLTARWMDLATNSVSRFCKAFEGFEADDIDGRPVAISKNAAVLCVHPIEDINEATWGRSVAEAAIVMQERGYAIGGSPRLTLATHFDLLRRPGHVYTQLWAS